MQKQNINLLCNNIFTIVTQNIIYFFYVLLNNGTYSKHWNFYHLYQEHVVFSLTPANVHVTWEIDLN